MEKQELSLRILLTLSLRNKWLITTTRATTACSQDAQGRQLRVIGLGQNKMDQNIFSGDELVILVHKSSILIGGPELQQECFFCELSALVSLEPPTKLAQDTPISFCNTILEYMEASHSISLRVPTSFCRQLLQRHDLEEIEPATSLEEEELSHQEVSEHNIALEADRQELYKQIVGDLVWIATTCRPDLSFEVHLLTQSLTTPTKGQEKQLQKVLSYLKGTLHYSLSLHPTTKKTKERVQSLELLAFSSSSWTEACRTTSTACLILWGVPLIASCRTACAYNQAKAELESVRLALALASHTKSLLQHLALEQLAKPATISLKTSSLHMELVTGRPFMQLGLSRRNKHIQLRGQLQLSKVHPNKNLAHSLSHNASDKTMLAKLRIDTEAAKILALSPVQGPCLASFVSSSSLLVGMVAAKPSQMEKPQLRQLALPKSVSFVRTCPESLSRNFADSLAKSFASLTWISLSFLIDSLTLHSMSLGRCSLTLPSLSLTGDRLYSLTLHSLSLTEGNLQSLTLQSLSLIDENRFQTISFREDSFEDGSLKETDESLAHNLAERRAETNSFSSISLQEKKPPKEAETNSFFAQSFSHRILSLSIWLRIFLLCSFQLICAALLLGNCSFTMSFPTESLQADHLEAAYFRSNFQQPSLQQEELVTAYSRSSFQQQSLQQDELAAAHLQSPTRASQLDSLEQMELCRINLESLIHQLDLETSLSLPWFNSARCRYQLQPDSFDRSSFEHRALP